MLNQVKMTSERNGPIYKFGVRVPRHRREAIALDKANGNAMFQYWDSKLRWYRDPET
jgi:hypothetical protein